MSKQHLTHIKTSTKHDESPPKSMSLSVNTVTAPFPPLLSRADPHGAQLHFTDCLLAQPAPGAHAFL